MVKKLLLCVLFVLMVAGASWADDCISGNCQDGYGTQTSSFGTKYVGGWKDGNQHGQGTYMFPDDRKLVDAFEDGKWKINRFNHSYTIKYCITNVIPIMPYIRSIIRV